MASVAKQGGNSGLLLIWVHFAPTPALYLWYLLGLGGKVITKTVSYSDLVSSGWEFAVSNL